MSANLVLLPSASRQPNTDLIEVLEEALRRAKAGELVAVALASVRAEGEDVYFGTDYAFGDGSASDLFASTSILRDQLLQDLQAT